MTKDEIIKLAREAGLGTSLCHNSVEGDRVWIEGADWHDELERFAALVAAAEREACAQIGDGYDYGDRNCGDEIRARGEQA